MSGKESEKGFSPFIPDPNRGKAIENTIKIKYVCLFIYIRYFLIFNPEGEKAENILKCIYSFASFYLFIRHLISSPIYFLGMFFLMEHPSPKNLPY